MVENLVIGSDFQQNGEASKTLHGIKVSSLGDEFLPWISRLESGGQLLGGETGEVIPGKTLGQNAAPVTPFSGLNFFQLCKVGLALTWPLLVPILGLIIYLALHFRR